jgi:glycosyltransferase involved in cell wall biosynthesis
MISFITTCKNRLSHIQETMPLLYAEAAKEEIIFVDYGCTQGSSDWVKAHYPKVKIVLVNDDPGFCAARASQHYLVVSCRRRLGIVRTRHP